MISSDFTQTDRAHLICFVRKLVSNPDTAEDIAHDALLRAQKFEHRGESSFTTWLYKIARNLCIDQYRRESRYQSCSFPELVADSAPEPQLCILDEQVHRAILGLDLSGREILQLRFYEGLSLEELAVRFQTPLSTQKSRLYRALAKLRKRLTN
jgi:RNA polymerase sigma-70 factor (ECF subfamily)